MLVYGLDFTSAPSTRKPITCARCVLHDGLLTMHEYLAFPTFADFENFLLQPGPWIAALDFPFGLPLKLLTNLAWPQNWEGYVQHVASLGKERFEDTLMHYRAGRGVGDKLHRRATDILANAISPMMLHRIPVGKMFFVGATRLLNSNVSILPCRPHDSDGIVLEGYPALVARKWLGKQVYKSDERKKQTDEHRQARQYLIKMLRSDKLFAQYGLKLELSADMALELSADPTGDRLDALLCAIQAAWAFMRREDNYGIPFGHEVEGWIVDPHTKSE